MVIEVQDLEKRYGDIVAVDHLSFEVNAGEIFGLMGPNGAGKTTTIRILMDILHPDAGTVKVLGKPPGQAKRHVGYLPEERGLYRNAKVLDVLIYLAQLKGTPGPEARERARDLLRQMQLDEWANRRVRDLSRGMQQRLQFAACLVHEPDVLILDEPFQALDPVNVERIKRAINGLRDTGTTIILSTHQMNMVEALCDRILLINRGRAVLYGPLVEVKKEYAPNTVRVRAPRLSPDLPGVAEVEPVDGAFNLTLSPGAGPQEILRALVDRGVEVQAFEVAPVPLEEIFVTAVSSEET
jgi:ABC-2 type transport system ATP-binding protein